MTWEWVVFLSILWIGCLIFICIMSWISMQAKMEEKAMEERRHARENPIGIGKMLGGSPGGS